MIGENDRLLPVDKVTGERVHVLLDFTGFRCVNCPTASALAETLQEQYEGKLLVVELHPASNPFTQGKHDYTCPAADSIYLWMGGTATTSFPKGNADMGKYHGEYMTDADQWTTMVDKAMQDSAAPMLRATATGDTITRKVEVQAQYELSDEQQIAIWLLEDSIEGPQAKPEGVDMHYMHRHVLREVCVGTTLQVPDTCNLHHCSIITMLQDKKDKTILNAYETTIDFGFDR